MTGVGPMSSADAEMLTQPLIGGYGKRSAYLDQRRQAVTNILAQKRALRELYKQHTFRPARVYVDEEGNTGYGRYRRRRVRRGRGGYWDDAFSKIGGWLGGYKPGSEERGLRVGNNIWNALPGFGRSAMQTAFAGVGRYRRRRVRRGRGAYGSVDQDVPQVSNPHGTDGAVVIRHKEYIGDIVVNDTTAGAVGGAQPFCLAFNLPINPGLASTFPWVSSVSQNFTQYRLEGCIFHYVPTSGVLSTTQALGEIVMSTNYNANDPSFTNKQQMLNEVMSSSRVPSVACENPIETANSQTTAGGLMFIRGGPLVSNNQDLRLYDIGNFQLATQGTVLPAGGSVTLGELWVSYQVALYKPQLTSINSYNNVNPGCFYHGRFASPTNTAPLGGTVTTLYDCFKNFSATGGGVTITGSGCRFSLPMPQPPGVYYALYLCYGTAQNVGYATNASINGYGANSSLCGNAFNILGFSNVNGGTTTSTTIYQLVSFTTTGISNPNYCYITLANGIGSVIPGAGTADLWIFYVGNCT